jgi:hypothetical protein
LSERIAEPRNRLVNFRVTEAEYVQIREACVARGCRGLSAYARWATLDSMTRRSTPEAPGGSWENVSGWLDDRFASLEASIRRVLQLLNSREGE